MQNPSRQGVADHSGHGDSRHKPGDDLCPPAGWEPVSQIKNDAREKASLGEPEQKP